MKTSVKAILLCFVFLLAQCAEKATLVDPGFIGVWSGASGATTYRLSIDEHSNAIWVRDDNGHYTQAQGVARVEGDDLHIGVRRLQINEYPTPDTVANTWTMILSGATYARPL